MEIRYLNTFANLGPYCASLYLYFEMQRVLQDTLKGRQCQLHKSKEDVDSILFDHKYPDSQENEINFVLDVLEDFKDIFPPDSLSTNIPIEFSLDWCSPKVKVLVDLLLEFEAKSNTFQCIIFVEQRQVASALSRVLQLIQELNNKIKSTFLVGQGVNSEGIPNYTDRDCGDAVKMFKDGLVNVRKSIVSVLVLFLC